MRIRNSLAMLALIAVSAACSAEVEDKGSLPDVDVKGGDMPNVDVDPAQVQVGPTLIAVADLSWPVEVDDLLMRPLPDGREEWLRVSTAVQHPARDRMPPLRFLSYQRL